MTEKKQLKSLFGDKTSRGIPIHVDPLSDFRKFLFLVWKHLRLPPPTPVQYDIANVLQRMAYGHLDIGDRIVIEAFRGVGKSWVTSAFVDWLLYMNPQLNILVVSASKMRADEFTTFTLRLIREIEALAHLIPERDQRQSSVAFDVAPARASHAPSVKSLGISGQLAGSRADIIIPDDIEVLNNSATQGMRDKLSEQIKEFDAILKPGGKIAYLGTPQTEMSIYNLLPDRGYKTFIWPARVPNEKQRRSYGGKLAKMIVKMIEGGRAVGSTTDPARFSDIDLGERELSYGRSGFALQFMLDTSLSDAEKYPLRLADLIVMDLDKELAPEAVIHSRDTLNRLDLPAVGFQGDAYHGPREVVGEWVPYAGSLMFIDPAGRGQDETSWVVVKALNSYLFVTSAGGLQGGYTPENLEKLAEIAKEQRVNLIRIEANFGDGMFTELFKPYLRKVSYPCTTEEVKHSTQKERRIIDTLEPVLNQHRLVIDRSVVEQDFESTKDRVPEKQLAYQLFYQLTRITKEKGALVHDDRLDALAGAVGYWVEAMALEAQERIKERQDAALRAELERMHRAHQQGLVQFLGEAKGGSSAPTGLSRLNRR